MQQGWIFRDSSVDTALAVERRAAGRDVWDVCNVYKICNVCNVCNVCVLCATDVTYGMYVTYVLQIGSHEVGKA